MYRGEKYVVFKRRVLGFCIFYRITSRWSFSSAELQAGDFDRSLQNSCSACIHWFSSAFADRFMDWIYVHELLHYLFIWDLGPNFASQTRKAGMSSFSLWRQWQAAHIIYYCIIYYYYTIRIIGFLLYNNNNSYYYCHCIIFSALIYRLLLD